MSAAWSAIRAAVSAAWDATVGKVVSGAARIISAISGLAGRIVGAVAGFGSLLVSAGRALIEGLVAGIVSRIHAVTDAISGVASKVKGFFGGSPVEEGPLLSWNNGGAGKQLVRMLAEGLEHTGPVDAAVRGLARRVADGMPTAAGGAGVAGGSGGAGVAFNAPVYVVDPDDLARTIVRRQQDANALWSIGSIAAVG
jgi:hypothetical protein